jgi:hypothetical protein
MENFKNRVFKSYSEFIQERKNSLVESMETQESDETNNVVDVIEPIESDQVKESKLILSFEEFVKNKNL